MIGSSKISSINPSYPTLPYEWVYPIWVSVVISYKSYLHWTNIRSRLLSTLSYSYEIVSFHISILFAFIFFGITMFGILAAALFPLTSALVHHIFVGNLQLPASIHLLEFDDEALTLFRANTFTADSSHAWIAFDASNPPSPSSPY